jgi:hypothetical protein
MGKIKNILGGKINFMGGRKPIIPRQISIREKTLARVKK